MSTVLEFSPGTAGPLWWEDLALCAQTGPELFFPEKGGSVRAAKRICRGCEVREQCLEFALQTRQEFGVWGGKSETERQRIRASRRTGRRKK